MFVLSLSLSSHPIRVLSPAGELINLAMYCERMRRRFWPEWFVDPEDWCYTGEESESGRSSPAGLLDFGLFSRTDTLEESDSSCGSGRSDAHSLPRSHTRSHTHAQADADPHTHSPDTDRSGRSLFDSDIDTDGGSDLEQKQEVLSPDL